MEVAYTCLITANTKSDFIGLTCARLMWQYGVTYQGPGHGYRIGFTAGEDPLGFGWGVNAAG